MSTEEEDVFETMLIAASVSTDGSKRDDLACLAASYSSPSPPPPVRTAAAAAVNPRKMLTRSDAVTVDAAVSEQNGNGNVNGNEGCVCVAKK
jgi:hypothetical protein